MYCPFPSIGNRRDDPYNHLTHLMLGEKTGSQ